MPRERRSGVLPSPRVRKSVDIGIFSQGEISKPSAILQTTTRGKDFGSSSIGEQANRPLMNTADTHILRKLLSELANSKIIMIAERCCAIGDLANASSIS